MKLFENSRLVLRAQNIMHADGNSASSLTRHRGRPRCPHARRRRTRARLTQPKVTTLRRHTNRKKRVAEDTLKQFGTLVTFSDQGYTFALTPAFKQAIARAEAAAKAKS